MSQVIPITRASGGFGAIRVRALAAAVHAHARHPKVQARAIELDLPSPPSADSAIERVAEFPRRIQPGGLLSPRIHPEVSHVG